MQVRESNKRGYITEYFGDVLTTFLRTITTYALFGFLTAEQTRHSFERDANVIYGDTTFGRCRNSAWKENRGCLLGRVLVVSTMKIMTNAPAQQKNINVINSFKIYLFLNHETESNSLLVRYDTE